MSSVRQAQKFFNQLLTDDVVLKFISHPLKWLDYERYLYCQQPYSIQYFLNEIFFTVNITELNGSYQQA